MAGSGITVSGTWPNQTIAQSASSSLAIGNPVGSGTAKSVLFVSQSTNLQQDSRYQYDSIKNELLIGSSPTGARFNVVTNAIATTQSDTSGILLQNTTAPTSGVPVQYSPGLVFDGGAWNTTTPAANDIRFRLENEPISGATTSGQFVLKSSVAGGAYSGALWATTAGGSTTFSGNIASSTGTLGIAGSGAIGTTSINSSAILLLNSNSKAFGLPQLTTTAKNAIASPKSGFEVMDTTLELPYWYNAVTGTWQTFITAVNTNSPLNQIFTFSTSAGAVSATQTTSSAYTVLANNTASTATAGYVSISSISATKAHTIFTPTTGGTVTTVNNSNNIINPVGTLATLTIALPASPANNDIVYLTFTQAITAITYSGGTVVGTPTSATLGGQWFLTFDSGSSTWY